MIGSLRALTDEDKEQVVKAILECWKQLPALRLGQLLDNALVEVGLYKEMGSSHVERDMFYVEDRTLVAYCKHLVNRSQDHDPK